MNDMYFVKHAVLVEEDIVCCRAVTTQNADACLKAQLYTAASVMPSCRVVQKILALSTASQEDTRYFTG